MTILRGQPIKKKTHNSANVESYKVSSLETDIVGSVHFALSYLNQHTNFPRVFKAETLLADLRKAGELFLRNRVRVDIQTKKVSLGIERGI